MPKKERMILHLRLLVLEMRVDGFIGKALAVSLGRRITGHVSFFLAEPFKPIFLQVTEHGFECALTQDSIG